MNSVFLLLAVLVMSELITYHNCAVKHRHKSAGYWEQLAKSQGPNVCVREVIPKLAVTYDKAWTGGSFCGIKTVVKLQCCEGFGMVSGIEGCPLVKTQLPLAETANSVGAATFVELQEAGGLSQWLSNGHQGAITILAPSNKALKQLTPQVLKELDYRVHRVSNFLEVPPLLLHHVLDGRVPLSTLPSDSLVPSFFNDLPVRFNVFPSGLVMANCVPIVVSDIQSSQGMLHVLEAPLETSSLINLAELVASRRELSRLAMFITQAAFGMVLKSPGPFTFFAPTDEAFKAISDDRLQVLLYNEQALKVLLNHHLVEGVHCSATLNNATLLTRADTALRSRCTVKGTKVSGANMTIANLMASNGVLHLIDHVLIPRRARSLLELLSDLGLTKLRSLLPTAGLEAAFKGRSTITVFAPTNQAFEALGNNTQPLSQAEIRNTLTGHMTTGRRLTRSLFDKQGIESLSRNKMFRMKLSSGKTMVNDAVILRPDIEGYNGVVHIINKVLLPPKFSIIKYLESEGIYTKFLDALNRTSPSLIELLESDEAPFTVFAVTDSSIDNWSADLFTYDRMMVDTDIVNSMMRNHVVPDTLFTTGLVPGNYYQVASLNHEPLLVRRWSGPRGAVYAGIALIQKPNILCTNGVIHVVNRLIQLANPSVS